MKYATQLALASVASCALSVQADSSVTTFAIDFDDYTLNATPSGTVIGGTWSGDVGAGSYVDTKIDSDRNLVLDAASNDPLVFTPTAENTASISMDVKFVAASAAQDPVKNTQVGLYVLKNETTKDLMVSVNGAAFADSGIDVEEDHWYTVKLTFDYTAGSKTVALSIYDVENSNTQVGSTYNTSSATTATKLNGIDFYGSGCVDNFVGSPAAEYATIPTSTQVDDDGTPATATIDATLVNGTLTTSFAATSGSDALKFITVSGTINGQPASRTLRVVNGQAINIDGCGFTAISGVTAYYGDVTATDGATPAIAPTVDNGQVSLSVSPKSGLYYSVDVNGTRTALNNNNPIAPEAEGTALNYTIDAANPAQGYGVKKFKVIASDDPVPAP